MTLPQGWAETTLGEVAETRLGKMLDVAKNKGEPVPYLRNVNVRWGSFDLSDLPELKVTENELTELSVRDGDLFVCEGGEPGRCAVWRGGPRPLVFQKALHRVRGLGGVEPDYLATFLTYAAANQQFDDLLTGTTIKHFPQVALQKLALPLPPLAEQRRIVAKLDALTARLARARAELDRVPVLAARFRQVAMAQVFGTEVKADWSTLNDVGLCIEAGKNLRCEERPPRPDEAGVVKVSAVSSEKFRPLESKTLPVSYKPLERDRICSGDLLLARASGSLALVGRVALVSDTPRNLFLSDKVLRLRLPEDLVHWVRGFLGSPLGRSQIEEAASGINMHNITQGALGAIKLPLPCVGERAAKLAKLEAAFARADRLEAEAARARALLDRLDSALLAKAFRGELVPQDPSDEPAQALLDRIRAQRAAAPKAKRGHRAKEAAHA